MQGVRASLRHRPGQAVGLFLLASVIVTAATFTPLFTRALDQSVTRLALRSHPPIVSGVTVGWSGPSDNIAGYTDNAVLPDDMAAYVTPGLKRDFGGVVSAIEAQPTATVRGRETVGRLVWRSGACAHLRMVAGTCPTATGTIAVSRADSAAFALHPGDSVSVTSKRPDPHGSPQIPLRVVGVYDQLPATYWMGLTLTGYTGARVAGPATPHDGWVTGRGTLDSPVVRFENMVSNLFLLPRPDLGIDRFLRLPAKVHRLQSDIDSGGYSGLVTVTTGVGSLVADVRHQQRQAATTVPTLMLQLAVLSLVVLWLALSTVVDQRRPELALALLRGHGRRGGRRLLLGELVPIMLAATVAGAVAGLACAWAATRWFLPEDPPVEPGRGYLLAALASAAVLISICLVAVVRVTREPIERLLRRVGPRAAGLRVGVGQAMLLSAAGALVAVFVSGGLSSSASALGPAFFALLVGLLVSILVTPVATWWSRRQLRRGRLASALAGLDAARSATTRRAVALLTVATALVVFAIDADGVGARNHDLAAAQAVGAPRVLTLDSTDVPTIQHAVAAINAHGVRATPVLHQVVPSRASAGLMAVEPGQFAQVAAGGRGLLPALSRLAAPATPPIRLRARSLAVTVTPTSTRPAGAHVVVAISRPDTEVATEDFGALGRRHRAVTIRRPVPCSAGCTVVGVGVSANPGRDYHGTFVLSDPGFWGPAARWESRKDSHGAITFSDDAHGLQVDYETRGSDQVVGYQRWLPGRLPAVRTGTGYAHSDGRGFTATAVNGYDHGYRQVAHAAHIPGAANDTVVGNLDLAIRGTSYDQVQAVDLWLADGSAALERRATQALNREGVHVLGSRTIDKQRRLYSRSAAGLSLGLGVGVGLAGLGIAILVLIVLAVSRWRNRSYDLAALRMAGASPGTLRRSTVLADLVAVVLAVIAGTAVGAGSAGLALRRLPLFTTPPAVDTSDLAPSWAAILIAALIAAATLGAAAWSIGRAAGRRAALQRLREAQ